MKVAILAPVPLWFLPGLEHLRSPGHYATWLEPLIPEFHKIAADNALEMHWITMSQKVNGDLTHEAHGQTFHVLARRSMGRQMVTGYTTEIRRIRRLLRRLGPDLVHSWGSEDVYGLAGAFSGVSPNRRIFTLQGCLTEYVRLLGGPWLFRLQAMYERPTIRRYRYATAESPDAAKLIGAINPDLDIQMIDYGVNTAFFEASWEPAVDPQVVFIGALNRRKGVADLVEIARRPELSFLTFRIIGEGPLRDELEVTAPKNVEWLGKCGRHEVVEHLESAWALVVPTYADTGPTVIKEARVVGLPVVTTTGAGAANYIHEADCGSVVQPGDCDGMARALLETCASVDTARLSGGKGHEQHRAKLHPKSTAEQFARLYRKRNSQLVRANY